MSKTLYRPEIDGLRTVAILPVVVFHLNPEWLPGGYLGVDVFFVISGYLITSLMVRELESGTFSFRRFWGRRIRRLLPALLATVSAVLIFGFLTLPRFERPMLSAQAGAALLSCANVLFWRTTGDYWGEDAVDSPLLHTWSLSVEEQFYLVFPLILKYLASRGRRTLSVGIVSITLASAALFIFAMRSSESAAFYLLPFRAWELGAGCCVALIHQRQPFLTGSSGNLLASALSLAGLVAIIGVFPAEKASPTLNLVAVAGAALIIGLGHRGVIRRLLATEPLPMIGKMSYSIYLSHWPVIVFTRELGIANSAPTQVGLIAILSIISYLLIERPTRHARSAVAYSLGGLAAALCLTAASTTLSSRYDTSRFTRATSHMMYFNLGDPDRIANRNWMGKLSSVDFILPQPGRSHDFSEGLVVGSGTMSSVLVIGDSHGSMWSHTIASVLEKRGLRAVFLCVNGTSPFPLPLPLEHGHDPPSWMTGNRLVSPAEIGRLARTRIATIDAVSRPIVILVARWSTARFSSARETLNYLLAKKARVLLVEQPPEISTGDHETTQWLAFLKADQSTHTEFLLPPGNVAGVGRASLALRALAATRSMPVASGSSLRRKSRTNTWPSSDSTVAAAPSSRCSDEVAM
jgi:peptidoglycan/LPS O-acetylase OafA/YrhL